MTRNVLFIASFSLLICARATAQDAGLGRTVVIENKDVMTPRSTCTEHASNVTFYEFMKHMKQHNGFDSEKLREAKQAAGLECFTSKQIAAITSGFIYDETRIDFAKFAYKYAFDKANYAQLKESFLSEDSWEEVADYIKHKK
jgi:hypothetical protein